MTHICVLISSDSDELSLLEDEDLSFGGEEGIVRAVLLHLHDVKTWLVLMKRLEHDHLEEEEGGRGREGERQVEASGKKDKVIY